MRPSASLTQTQIPSLAEPGKNGLAATSAAQCVSRSLALGLVGEIGG